MKITEHFSLEEFKQPAKYGIPETSYPEEWIEERLRHLCDSLESIRLELGCPIRICSGYRSRQWNDAHIAAGHNAAKNSMHIHGLAADIVVVGIPASIVQAKISRMYIEGRLKMGGFGRYDSFTHIDLRQIINPKHKGLAIW